MWAATSIFVFFVVVLACVRFAPEEWLFFLVGNAQLPALGWFLVMSTLSFYLLQRARQVESIDEEARPETIHHRANVIAALESRLAVLMCVMVLVGLYTLFVPALADATQGQLKLLVASTLPGFLGFLLFVLLSWLSWLHALGKLEADIKARIRRREMRRRQLERIESLTDDVIDVEAEADTIEGELSELGSDDKRGQSR